MRNSLVRSYAAPALSSSAFRIVHPVKADMRQPVPTLAIERMPSGAV